MSNFLENYNQFIINPKVQEIDNYFSTEVVGFYKFHDLGPNIETDCPTEGCVVFIDIDFLKKLIKKHENKAIKQKVMRTKSLIQYPENNYFSIVTTDVTEEELVNDSTMLETSNYTEKIYLNIINKRLIITQFEIILNSVTGKNIEI